MMQAWTPHSNFWSRPFGSIPALPRPGRCWRAFMHGSFPVATQRSRVARRNAIDLRFQTREYGSALRLIDDGLNLQPDDLDLIACKVLVYQWLGQLDQADAVISGLHPRTAEDLPVFAITNQARFRRAYAGAISQLQALQPDRGSGSADWAFSTFNICLGDRRRLTAND